MSTDASGFDASAILASRASKDTGVARSLIDLQKYAGNERARIWRQAMCEKHFNMDIHFASISAPGGSIVHASVGAIGFSAMESVPQSHERTPQNIRDENDHLLAVMQFRGEARVTQSGRVSLLRPGRFLVADGAAPYYAELVEDYQNLVVRIPRTLFSGAFPDTDDFINICLDESLGGSVVVSYFRAMARDFDRMTPEQLVAMSGFGIDLITNTLAASL